MNMRDMFDMVTAQVILVLALDLNIVATSHPELHPNGRVPLRGSKSYAHALDSCRMG